PGARARRAAFLPQARLGRRRSARLGRPALESPKEAGTADPQRADAPVPDRYRIDASALSPDRTGLAPRRRATNPGASASPAIARRGCAGRWALAVIGSARSQSL